MGKGRKAPAAAADQKNTVTRPFEEADQGSGFAPDLVHPHHYAFTPAGYPDALHGMLEQLSFHKQQYAHEQQFHPQQLPFRGQQVQSYHHHQLPCNPQEEQAPAPSQEQHLQSRLPQPHRHRQRHPGGPYELGSEAQIGYRTAWRYRLDRHKWTEQARRRRESI